MSKGENALRSSLARLKPQPKQYRTKDPTPGEDDWPWWVEKRMRRIENLLYGLIGIGGAILAERIYNYAMNLLSIGSP
jgi:hypothetical protein